MGTYEDNDGILMWDGLDDDLGCDECFDDDVEDDSVLNPPIPLGCWADTLRIMRGLKTATTRRQRAEVIYAALCESDRAMAAWISRAAPGSIVRITGSGCGVFDMEDQVGVVESVHSELDDSNGMWAWVTVGDRTESFPFESFEVLQR